MLKQTNRAFRNRIISSIAIALFSLCLTATLSSTYPLDRVFTNANLGLENILLSMKWLGGRPVHPAISLVTIDDNTLSDVNGGLGRWQDFRREYYAKVIDRLKKDGALVIGVDVLFSEKSSTGDDTLASSIKNAGNVVLGFSRQKKIFPLQSLSDGAIELGYFDPNIHPVNGYVYSYTPASKVGTGVYESFSFAVIRKYFDAINGTETRPGDTSFGQKGYTYHEEEKLVAPYAGNGKSEVLINYLPNGGIFPSVSFRDVYNAEIGKDPGGYNKKYAENRIVLIGATASALHDEFITPVGIKNGIVVHANLVNTVLEGTHVTFVSKNLEMGMIICLSLLFSLFLLHVGNRFYQMIISIISVLIAMSFHFIIFQFGKLLNFPTELSLIVISIVVLALAYKYIWEEEGKRLLKNALSQYLAEDLVASVLSNYEWVQLGGVRKEVTLFFSDIEGFTTLSERMEPEELVGFLSVYLKWVSDVIIHHRGFINKYEGDAVMAIWWAFAWEAEQARLACVAALEQQAKIDEMNQEFEARFGFRIRARMGINKWPAVVGNIGSQWKKIEYTALGDTVNTASRLEGINKLYGTLICVGENVKTVVGNDFVFRKLDSIMVKGKDKPTTIYELVGNPGTVSADKLGIIRDFERALEMYMAAQFGDALPIFKRLSALWDAPSKTFLERAEHLIETGAGSDWNGSFRATEK